MRMGQFLDKQKESQEQRFQHSWIKRNFCVKHRRLDVHSATRWPGWRAKWMRRSSRSKFRQLQLLETPVWSRQTTEHTVTFWRRFCEDRMCWRTLCACANKAEYVGWGPQCDLQELDAMERLKRIVHPTNGTSKVSKESRWWLLFVWERVRLQSGFWLHWDTSK